MNKTQKKCLMASVAMHALLIVILAVAPAFLKKDVEIKEPPIDFIPSKVAENLINPGGGAIAPQAVEKAVEPAPRPPVKIPQPAPPPPPRQKPVVKHDPPKPPPTPQKKVEPVKKPDPPKKPPVKIKTKPIPPPIKKQVVKAKPQPKKSVKPPPKIKVDLTAVTRLKNDDSVAKQRAARERERQRAEANARAKAAAQYALLKKQNEKAWVDNKPNINLDAASKSAERIRSGLQPSLSVGLTGSGDAAYASYAQLVKTIYVAAIEEQGRQMGKLGDVIKVRITIARSGKVIEETILSGPQSSGFGRAVQAALNRVDQIRPFSPGSTDTTRTYTINFRLPSN